MNISLTPTLEKFVQDKVASGFYNFEITSKAYKDIEIIADYIAKENKNVALKFVKLFNKTFEILCLNPYLGRIRKDFTYLDVCSVL